MKKKKRQKIPIECYSTDDRGNFKNCLGLLHEYCEGWCLERPSRATNALHGYLQYYSRIPRFILDNYLRRLSGSALKIFLFLNQRATFDPHSKHFGRCWVNYTQIAEGTGVSKDNIYKYTKELQDLNLIRKKTTQKQFKDKGWKTSNLYTVTWHSALKEVDQKRRKKDETSPDCFGQEYAKRDDCVVCVWAEDCLNMR